jgi:leucyl aminopeptidase (aminopeptidase T)
MNTSWKVVSLVLVTLMGGIGALAAQTSPAFPATKPDTRSAVPFAETARLADTIINHSAGIRPGEIVWITGGTRDQQLLEDLAIQVRKLGAHPLLTFGSDRLELLSFTEVPAKFDSLEPKLDLKLADFIDAAITIDFNERPDLLASIPPQRLNDAAKTMHPVHQKVMDRNVVQVNLGNGLYPTTALAERFNVPQADLARLFWNAVNTDYTQLQAIGESVRTRLSTGKSVRITAPNGTDLTLDITQRPVFVSDGVVSSEDRYAGGPNCQVWLPAGEVYVTPVPGTANGTFVADNFFFEGEHIEGLTFKFTNGKLASLSAKNDMTTLQRRYDAAPAGREVFAALDIGINPAVSAPSGSRMVTWMGSGTISVGVGGNAWAGGDNHTPFDIFAHLPNGTLTIDGTPLITQGKLTTTNR